MKAGVSYEFQMNLYGMDARTIHNNWISISTFRSFSVLDYDGQVVPLSMMQRIQEGRQLNSLHCQQTTDVTESVSQMKPTLSQTGMGYSLTACTQSYLETSGSLPHLYVSGPLVMSLLNVDLDCYFEFPTSFVCS